jgi:LCP family protein required for cell wall assembly
MSHEDWNPDDFLDFDYGEKGSQKEIKQNKDEYSEYLASRHQNANVAKSDTRRSKPSDVDREALQKAQQEAYDRYRSNYDKNYQRKYGTKKKATPSAWLARIYLIALALFAGSMAIMDVLPIVWLLVLLAVLILVTALVLPKMRRGGKRKGTRAIATLLSILLIFIYGVGTAYALGTLSFLSSTSVKNDKHVSRITKEPFNVVITGIDVEGTIDEEGRSDVNMLLTVNPKTAQLLMTSIPRDYQIYLRDKDNAMDKLTHTGFYGVQSTIAAEEDLLGITANYYVKVNFTTVKAFINAVGGIDVYSEYEFEPVKLKGWTVHEGMNHMDGEQALAFARERKAFDDGDRQRIKNQQAVFEAMFKKATSSKTMLLNYSNVLAELKDYVEMSFSSREVRSLVKYQIAKNLDWSIYKNTLTGGDDMQPLYGTGGEFAYVMSQDEESISHAKTLIDAVMKGEPLTKDDDGNVNVLNDEGDSESEGETEE